MQPQLHEPHRRNEHAEPDRQPAHDRGQHVGGEELEVGNRREQDKHDVARDLGLHQARGTVGERVLERAHHHESGHQKIGVRDAVVDAHAALQRIGEYDEVEHRRENRSRHGLHRDLPEAQQLLLEERLKTRHFPVRRKNTSSRSGGWSSISMTFIPASRKRASPSSNSPKGARRRTKAPPPLETTRPEKGGGKASRSSRRRSSSPENDSSRLRVESSATMRPAFRMAMRLQWVSASSR